MQLQYLLPCMPAIPAAAEHARALLCPCVPLCEQQVRWRDQTCTWERESSFKGLDTVKWCVVAFAWARIASTADALGAYPCTRVLACMPTA